MKPADNFDAKKWLVENKITTQSRLNENSRSDMWKLDIWVKIVSLIHIIIFL